MSSVALAILLCWQGNSTNSALSTRSLCDMIRLWICSNGTGQRPVFLNFGQVRKRAKTLSLLYRCTIVMRVFPHCSIFRVRGRVREGNHLASLAREESKLGGLGKQFRGSNLHRGARRCVVVASSSCCSCCSCSTFDDCRRKKRCVRLLQSGAPL